MTGDPETEKKLRKQVKKYKALLQDCQEELEHEREQRSNAAAMRGLRSQLEDLELRESAAVKAQKRLQSELDELLTQFEELTRNKLEVGREGEREREYMVIFFRWKHNKMSYREKRQSWNLGLRRNKMK